MLTAIIVAGGSSQRMGFDKTFAPLAGVPAIAHPLLAFERCDEVDEIIVVGRADRLDEIRKIATDHSVGKISHVLGGGAARQDSVRAGLAELSSESRFVAVHDAARALITPGQISAIFSVAKIHGAAAAARPIADTLKRGDKNRLVSGSVDRQGIYAMETPQIFARDLLLAAYEKVRASGITVTDEVSAVELLGNKVVLVAIDGWNFKITYPHDLQLAELILDQRNTRSH